MLNKSKYIVWDSSKQPPFALMTALHTLGILSTSFTWNAFPKKSWKVLKELPHMLSTWLAAFPSLCGPTHPKPSQLGWGRVCAFYVCHHQSVTSKAPPHHHMWELFQDCWKCIPGDYLMKLVERMPRMCKAVIKAKGGYFEESIIYFYLFNTFLVTTWFHMC